MDRDLLQLMTQTISVSTVATLGSGGAPTYSTTAASFRARVVNTNKIVHDTRGQVASVAYVAWVDSTGILSPTSRYTLPDGATPPVVRVDAFPDEDGASHHVRIYFGRP